MLSIDDARAEPKLINSQGGEIAAVFSASTISGASRLTAKYLLFATDPYVFQNPAPDGPKTAFLATAAVDEEARDYRKALTLVRQGPGASVLRVDVRLEVQEIDAQGNPIGKPEKDIFSVTVAPDQAVKQMREASGMTQQELADKAGVSVSTISRLERGMGVSDDTLSKLDGVV